MSTNLAASSGALNTERTFRTGVVLVGVAVVSAILLLALSSDVSRSFPYFFLLPWVLLLLVALAVPSFLLYKWGRFSLADPIVFAAWSYFFPAFVIGGIALAVGWSQPYFLSYIQDAEVNLPWTMVLIALGYSGLSIGYFLPIGEVIGRVVGDLIRPAAALPIAAYDIPAAVLVVLGVLNSVVALALGIIGFQGSREIASYDGLVFLSTLFWLEGTFILWYVAFRKNEFSLSSYVIIVLLVMITVFKALFAGNRGSLLQSAIAVFLAFMLSGRGVRVKQIVIGSSALALLLLIGMIYGTTFRHIRGNDASGGIGDYTENVIEAVTQVSNSSSTEAVEFGLSNLAERIDVVSSLAVVVSNYEELAPYEAGYGLDDNIQKDFITTFIPRVLWNDKPVASDARRYGDLYFDYGENSFAMTPIGDLLRNYGVAGVFFGMFLLGILLRLVYRTLVENREPSVGRITVYYMILVSVSYEGFYGLIFPFALKIGITAVVGVLIVNFLAKRIYGSAAKGLHAP